jgi:hypothetical protein
MTFLSESRPVARKVHRCAECQRDIEKGTRYYSQASVCDGSVGYYRAHLECSALARVINAATHYDGWIFLHDDWPETIYGQSTSGDEVDAFHLACLTGGFAQQVWEVGCEGQAN